MVVIILQSSQWFMIGTVIVFAVVGYHIVDHCLPQLCLLLVVFINSCIGQQLCWLTVVLIHKESNLVLLFYEKSSTTSDLF